MNCKYCGSPNVVKFGTFNGIQRYWCKDCKRKFADNKALLKMKTPEEKAKRLKAQNRCGSKSNAGEAEMTSEFWEVTVFFISTLGSES